MSDELEHGAPNPAVKNNLSHPAGWEDSDSDWDGESAFKPLTPEQVKDLRAKHPPLSPWRVVAVQAVAGLVAAALFGLLAPGRGAGWSALYGAAAVVLPQALLARGMGRLPLSNAGAAALAFMFWEFVKVAVAVGMLIAARYVVPDLRWLALLVAVVVCLKASWVALWLQRRSGQ